VFVPSSVIGPGFGAVRTRAYRPTGSASLGLASFDMAPSMHHPSPASGRPGDTGARKSVPPQHGSGKVTAMIDDHVPPAAESTVPRQGVTVSPLGRYAIGVAAAVVGLLPWLLTGMRLPLQNLWSHPTSPEDMQHAQLVFNQYFAFQHADLPDGRTWHAGE